jgi:hypothetical protein
MKENVKAEENGHHAERFITIKKKSNLLCQTMDEKSRIQDQERVELLLDFEIPNHALTAGA